MDAFNEKKKFEIAEVQVIRSNLKEKTKILRTMNHKLR